MEIARVGVVLAGGTGSRLGPLTRAFSKHLLPVFDQPMIFAPIALLMQCGVREILLVCAPRDLSLYRTLLGNGSAWGISLKYVEQKEPLGLLDAFVQAREFVADRAPILALGDNVFCGQDWNGVLVTCAKRQQGASVLAVCTEDPSSYGIVDLDEDGSIRALKEKPPASESKLAVPGLYFYDKSVFERAERCLAELGPHSGVTELHLSYLADSELRAERIPDSVKWFDAGRAELLLAAGSAFAEFSERTGRHACSPDEIALSNGWISKQQLAQTAELYAESQYGRLLRSWL